MTLTPLQARFVAEYLTDFNGSQAAIRAGYSENRAAATASELLKKPAIARRVAAAIAAAEERTGITLDRVLTELGRIAFFDLRKVARWRSNVLTEIENPDDPFGAPDILHVTDIELIASEDLEEATASAIAEISRSSTGALKVKAYPKIAALKELRLLLTAAMRQAKPKTAGADDKPKPADPPPAPPSIWDDQPSGDLPN